LGSVPLSVPIALAVTLAVAALIWSWRRRRRLARRYRLLAEQMPQSAVAIFDRDLRFRLVAGQLLERAGWNPKQTEGRSLRDVVPSAHAVQLEAHCRAALKGESRSFEYRTGDGREYWVRLAPMVERGSRISGGLATILDVTDHKRAARELGHAAADVEAVTEATRSLARSNAPSDARIAVCEGARQVAGAPVAALFEPAPDGRGLVARAVVGADLRGMYLSLADGGSGPSAAFGRAQAAFVTEGDARSEPDRDFLLRTEALAALWHPVVRDRAAIGVLAVAWREEITGVSLRLSSLIDLLAAEAAVAIGRADLFGRLEQMARTDDLTGLPNRRAWQEQLPTELARSWREDRSLCVAMLDLDHFKQYNDREGHQAGDRLLEQAAVAWRTSLRPYDTLARYGGEEFSVILPGCTLDDALGLVERLRQETPEGETCSAGIAEWDGEEQADALVGRADAALYRAKRAGRDRSIVAPGQRTHHRSS
jgi:diguanylate cyclase (GGDEF)-like protein/PAS domain S-box-containing protein